MRTHKKFSDFELERIKLCSYIAGAIENIRVPEIMAIIKGDGKDSSSTFEYVLGLLFSDIDLYNYAIEQLADLPIDDQSKIDILNDIVKLMEESVSYINLVIIHKLRRLLGVLIVPDGNESCEIINDNTPDRDTVIRIVVYQIRYIVNIVDTHFTDDKFETSYYWFKLDAHQDIQHSIKSTIDDLVRNPSRIPSEA